MRMYTFILCMIISAYSFAQKSGDVLITEIANSGGKKGMYRGGTYIELQIMKDGVKLGGCFLTDYSSTGGTAKERQGALEFLNTDESVFSKPLAAGTIVLICLESPELPYGGKEFAIDRAIDDNNKLIVVFPYHDSTDIKRVEGTVGITGKDNIALLAKWDRKAAMDVVSWGREVRWEGSPVSNLPLEYLDNGHIIYLKNGIAPEQRNLVDSWVTTTSASDATPGSVNK